MPKRRNSTQSDLDFRPLKRQSRSNNASTNSRKDKGQQADNAHMFTQFSAPFAPTAEELAVTSSNNTEICTVNTQHREIGNTSPAAMNACVPGTMALQQSSQSSGSSRALVLWRPQEDQFGDEFAIITTVEYPRIVCRRPDLLTHAFTASNRHVLSWLGVRPCSVGYASHSSPSYISYVSSTIDVPRQFSHSAIEKVLMLIRDSVHGIEDEIFGAAQEGTTSGSCLGKPGSRQNTDISASTAFGPVILHWFLHWVRLSNPRPYGTLRSSSFLWITGDRIMPKNGVKQYAVLMTWGRMLKLFADSKMMHRLFLGFTEAISSHSPNYVQSTVDQLQQCLHDYLEARLNLCTSLYLKTKSLSISREGEIVCVFKCAQAATPTCSDVLQPS